MKSQIKKICLAAMLIALSIIATKVIGINPGFSFVRISFGPALIIFSSLYLGPIYGFIVGAASDALGAFLIPTGSYEPLFTIVYGLLGVLPWLLNFLFKKIKNFRIAEILYDILMILLLVLVVTLTFVFPVIEDEILRYVYCGVGAVLSISMIVVSKFMNNFFKKKNEQYDGKFYRYGLVCIISEIVCMMLLNSLVKAHHFELPYLLIFEWVGLIAFINITINSFATFYLEIICNKIGN